MNERSKKLTAAWAELFVEYFDRAGVAEPMNPFHCETGLEVSDQNRIAVSSRREVFAQTVKFRDALGLENDDLKEALKPVLKKRFSFIDEKPKYYLPPMLEDFEDALAPAAFSVPTEEELEADRQALDLLYPGLWELIKEARHADELHRQTPAYLELEKEEDKKRLQLEASFAELTKIAENYRALSPLAEKGRRPEPESQRPIDQGKAPEKT